MSTIALTEDHHGSTAVRDWSGPAPKRIVTGFGFWIFILSDIVMFSAFFATYAVLLGQTAGGPSGRDLFDLRNVAIETGFLLASSFTCGLASIAADARNKIWFQAAMAVTCAFGLAFLTIELREFSSLWHALDIIWIAVFTVVYLIGSAK
jgi:cytochrome o ubiquinol oxidase subunit 3